MMSLWSRWSVRWSACIRQLMTGADNSTLAFGRVFGALVGFLFVVLLPSVVAVVYLAQHVKPREWIDLFDQLKTYIPLMVVSVAALVSGTAFTEPKKPPQ